MTRPPPYTVQPATSANLPSLETIVPRAFHPTNPYITKLFPDTPNVRSWWTQIFSSKIASPKSSHLLTVTSPSDPDTSLGVLSMQLFAPTEQGAGFYSTFFPTSDHDAGDYEAVAMNLAAARESYMSGKAHLVIELFGVDHGAKGLGLGKIEQNINDHPLASKLPANTDSDHPTLHPGSETFHELVTSSDHGTCFSDWTDTDRPALSFHIVSFDDATLLTISWSHVFLDALGRQYLLKAWIAVLDGREEDVPDFLPLSVDPAEAVAQGGDPRQHVLFALALNGLWFALFVAGYIYELIIHSKEATHMVCCPGPWVDRIREEAMHEVRDKYSDGADTFLSHGDVLLAWWAKTATAAQNLSASQPVNIVNVTNCRGIYPEHLPAAEDSAYTGNAATTTSTLVTAGELQNISVGNLALRLRRDLQMQRSPEQTRHFVAWQIESKKRYGRLPLTGSWSQLMMAWSNWHRGRFFDVDFSSAVKAVGTPLEKRANKLGRPSFILPNGHTNGLSLRNGGPLIGRDAKGDWWLQSTLRAEAWGKLHLR